MVLDWFKRMLGGHSKPTLGDSEERASVVLAGVRTLKKKIGQLNKFKQACDEAGLEADLKKATLSANAFATECLAFIKSRGDQEAVVGTRSRYDEVTSNLMTLAVSANSVGINLQAEARGIFESINDLMDTMGLSQE